MATLDNGGVKLAYEDEGSGAPPLVLVHGWGGSSADLGPQAAHFSRSHRVVSVDRRGHGASDAPLQEYTIEGFSDDLAHVCREIGLGAAVVVQHSFDRLAYDFAARYPQLVAALVVLDGPTFAGDDFERAAHGFLAGLESPAWEDAIRGFARQLVFPPGMPQEAQDAALAGLLATPRHVLVSSWRHFIAYDAEAAVAAIRCPVLYVGGSMPARPERLVELGADATIDEVRGVGHFIQLAASDEVNRIVAGFVATLEAGRPARR